MSALPAVLSRPGYLIDPDTGEAIALADLSPEVLAHWSDYLNELGREARSWRTAFNDELGRRLAAERSRKGTFGRFAVEASEKREWDPDLAWAALGELVAAGLVTAAEAAEAMPEVTTRKPDGRRLNSILTRVVGEDPVAAQALAQARASSSYVKVVPGRPEES